MAHLAGHAVAGTMLPQIRIETRDLSVMTLLTHKFSSFLTLNSPNSSKLLDKDQQISGTL